MYGRFALGLRAFFRRKISLEEAGEMVRQRFREREDNFLRLVERGIFEHPRSPYLPLLRLAGCELGDIRNMVRKNGLEDTLRALRENGVYISFEEFKGRQPVIRGGQTFRFDEFQFNNPHLGHYYHVESGGSTGPGTRVPIDLDHLAVQAPNIMLSHHVHGTLDMPMIFWLSILPSPAGVNHLLRHSRFDRYPVRWFSPVTSGNLRPALKYRLATTGIIRLGRLLGCPLPGPEFLGLDRTGDLARLVAEILRDHGRCLVRASVSMSLRICQVARDEGMDFTGAVFMTGGEPPTPAKTEGITATGARYFPSYFFAETGVVGMGCADPADENDVHFFSDLLAFIQYPRRVPGSGLEVEPFLFTSLMPTAPRILLNVENDDYGLVDRRRCGCPFGEMGYGLHLRGIRSFGKLTSEGVTLVGSEMVHILERVLPEKFGGGPLDYQLMEEEGEDGLTRLNLLISPEVGHVEESEAVGAVLRALGEGSVSADLSRSLWEQARLLRVRRKYPVWTDRGKLIPLRRSGHAPAGESITGR
jgi:hypothetical protein